MPARRWMLALVFIVVFALPPAVAPPLSVVHAASLTVCASGCTDTRIQDALNTAASGDSITVGAGIYTGTLVISQSVTLQAITAGSVTLDAQHAGSAITIKSGVVATLDGLTIVNGTSSVGADIDNNGALTLRNSTVMSGTASQGGGGIANQGIMTITGSTIDGNNSPTVGGGIQNSGHMTISLTTVSHNSGDGITNMSVLSLISSTVGSNVGLGGAGGGINNAAQMSIANSTIISNTNSGPAGGIYSNYTPITITNSTISHNSAVGSTGGGIVSNSTLTLINSTVYSNTAGSGAGGLVATSAVLARSIIAGNVAGGTVSDCATTVVSLGYNLIGDGVGCSGLTNGTNGDQAGTSATPLNPQLGIMADNGGPTLTLLPATTSPAVDVVPLSSCVLTIDQRGFPRPAPGATACTVGAVDYQPHPSDLYVAPMGVDMGACVVSAPCQTIQYAVNQVSENNDTIHVAAGTYQQVVVMTGTGAVALSIVGAGANQTIITGTSAGTFQPLVTITGTVAQVTLSGLTLRGAAAAGVENAGRSVEVTRIVSSTIAHNHNFASGGAGGGIATSRATTVVENSTVDDNAGVFGGGLSVADGGTLTVTNSTIWNNTTTGQGGGIAASGSTVTLLNATIAGNYGVTSGGVGLLQSSSRWTNSIVAGNSIGDPAGGADCFNYGGSSQVTSGGYNVVGILDATANCSGLTNGTNGDQAGTSAAPLNPQLGIMADNGGPTLTLLPTTTSPAVDVVPLSSCVLTIDQRGFPRPAPGATACTVGAVEANLSVAPTSTPTPTAGPITVTLTLQAGWNLITLPVSPTIPLDGQALLTEVRAASHGAIAELASWTGANWVTAFQTNTGVAGNLTPQIGQGYFLYTDQLATVVVTGTVPTMAPVLSLHAGWNLIGDPLVTAGQTASTLLTSAQSAGLSPVEVADWTGVNWQALIAMGAGTSGTNFTLGTQQGYFLYVQASGQWQI